MTISEMNTVSHTILKRELKAMDFSLPFSFENKLLNFSCSSAIKMEWLLL